MVSDRFAYLLPQRPHCHCATTAARRLCEGACLTHGEFGRAEAPNAWPAPDPHHAVIIMGLRHGIITGANGHPVYCVIGGIPRAPGDPYLRWPGPPDPSAPRDPEAPK